MLRQPPEITDARVRRGVQELRRTYRRMLMSQIRAVEDDLEATIGAYLPLTSHAPRLANGNRSPEDELLGVLREATSQGRYHLPHYRVLTRHGGCAIDELTSSAPLRELDPETAVKAIAAKIECARRWRGRGGSYGAIRWGLCDEILREIGCMAAGPTTMSRHN